MCVVSSGMYVWIYDIYMVLSWIQRLARESHHQDNYLKVRLMADLSMMLYMHCGPRGVAVMRLFMSLLFWRETVLCFNLVQELGAIYVSCVCFCYRIPKQINWPLIIGLRCRIMCEWACVGSSHRLKDSLCGRRCTLEKIFYRFSLHFKSLFERCGALISFF